MPARRITRILLWTVLALLVVVAAGVIVILTVPAPLERWLEGQILIALREHYQVNVKLENLHVTLVPEFYATADNFVLPNRAGADVPPLITVKHITMRAAVFELLRSPVHVSWLKLDGLVVQVSPKRAQPPATPARNTQAAQRPKPPERLSNFIIDKVDADGTELYILRKDPAREPMRFDLRHLTLRSAGVGQPMNFTAELTNPTPPGVIQTTGRFGPWNFDETSATAVSGHYNFAHADLSVFNGISGILSSVGDYKGVLHNIVVDGTTNTPDFKLDRGSESVHLTTQFHATVDGTNGNTYLQPVNARFLQSSVITRGEVTSKPGEHRKTITLDVDVPQGRVQDVMALATRSSTPALTGQLVLHAKLQLPPGADPVLERMLLNGNFEVSGARFTSEKISDVIAELSRRGLGKPGDTSITNVPAEFAGDFSLGRTNLTFGRLQFFVPGAAAKMSGAYALHSQTLNFVGDVRLKATVSQMMTGSKRWLLAPFDPIFMRHGAGTYLPVAITGTRDHPEVHVEWKKLF
jgi:uncharacterized protein involved in outer membrane biogenesis